MQSINNSTELNNSTLASSELQDNRSNAPVVKLCPHSAGVSCGSCRLNELCLPIALSEGEMQQLDDIVERNRPYKKADHLYRQHDEFRSIFAVRSGSFKTYVLSSSGSGRVTGFYLPGEIIGMDGIADRTHANSAVALEHASICEIPFSQLESLSLKLPSLQHNFSRFWVPRLLRIRKFTRSSVAIAQSSASLHFYSGFQAAMLASGCHPPGFISQ